MKKRIMIVCAAALALSVLGGFTLGDSSLREYYSGLLKEGVITGAEYEKLEAYGFELPESEKEPLDDFTIGEIGTGLLPAEAR